ncbi:MAG: AAA family ATPase [Candidatus Omnitrophica bacterium]|nr:AAA family ATPase [Candidatus Omnitrophota bacterium]
MKIVELEVKNIRGIKQIIIKPDGKNVVVYGPNGTGKSAVVDAVDFLLCGKITRLTGEGTDGLELKEHGCHIDARKDLKNTIVKAKVEFDGKIVEIERSINKPSVLKVEPKEQEEAVNVYLSVAKLGQHVLSRREILRYITSEAAKRAKQIQSLLNLMDIENLRATLVTVRNEAAYSYNHEASDHEVAKSEVVNLLSLTVFSKEAALVKVNELLALLGGKNITELSLPKIKEGLTPYLVGAKKEALTKEQIQNTIKEVKDLLLKQEELEGKEEELKKFFEDIGKETKLKQYSLYKKLFEAGINLADDSNICPLCGKKWTEGSLKDILANKSKEFDLAKDKQAKIDEASTLIRVKVELLKKDFEKLQQALEQFGLKVSDDESVKTYLSVLISWSDTLLKPLETFEGGKWSSEGIKGVFDLDLWKTKFFDPLDAELKKATDELSKQQVAWETLIKMEDTWRRYEESLIQLEHGELYKQRSEATLSYFEKARDTTLENIYNAVKGTFDKYYKVIHSEDEEAFVSNIHPDGAALIFEVDFYGRGMFPPHALHSEGHQDSMGVCLFFALNEYLTKDTLKIIVLDDVVMSIDRNHRRAICKLLKENFPDKQFIITTHETAWAKQLKTEGVVTQKNMYHFVNWNIDKGPTVEMDKDLWSSIKECLDKDDVPSAAHKLRREAECFFENVCDSLYANVPYKGSYQWELGELAPSAVSTLKGYIKKAKDNFQRIKQQDKVDKLDEILKKINDVVQKLQVEQWAVNENVHFNKLSEMGKEDFEPVVEAFKEFFGLFVCPKCGALIFLSQEKSGENKITVSCGCGEIFWNIT